MWYFEEAGQSIGPVSEAEIRAAIAAGRIDRATLVWRDGMGGWVAAGQTELASAFGAPPGMWTGAAPAPGAIPGAIPGTAPGTAPGTVPALAGYSTPGYGGQPVRFAGFWIRAWAYLLDTVMLQLGAFTLGSLVGSLLTQLVLISDRSMAVDTATAAGWVVGLLWTVGYYMVSMSSRWQATPGKRLAGLRVLRTDGKRVGPGLALGRWLAYIPSSIILGFGFFMIGWTEQNRALHDMICSTRVVHGRA